MNDIDDTAIRRALGTVMDPELDEPITDLGFVRSIHVDADRSVTVHLRLPTSFCSPNFAYLMASDAKDALRLLPDVYGVTVVLDDHHDSDIINRGLAADAGYCGTFGHEADNSLDELRMTFVRKAHTAAMERVLTSMLRNDPTRTEQSVGDVVIADLPETPQTEALRRRREALGLTNNPHDHVLVDQLGRQYPPEEVPLHLRRARSTRISVDGNAHFCRGLLQTRYPGSEADQAPRPADPSHLLPVTAV